MKPFGRLAAFLLISTSTACGDDTSFQIFEPGGLQPGRLEFFDDAARISVPATAAVGESFLIEIQTYGGGCIEGGPTTVKLLGTRLDVRPLDEFPDPDRVCTADIRLIDHSVTYSVDIPMTLEVAIHGVKISEAGREDITVTRTIVIGGG